MVASPYGTCWTVTDVKKIPSPTRMQVQGEWFLSGKSNLILTERKHAINFNLKVDSDQGMLGI